MANPYQCFYHNPHKYTTVSLLKWTKKYLECYVSYVHEQHVEILKQLGFDIIEASRIPPRTRNVWAKKQNVYRIRLLGKWYYIAAKENVERLQKNERRRLERGSITKTHKASNTAPTSARRIVRHARCLTGH